ncbi:MAG: TonB-dependent receptor [Dysgonamonadaceae bacterium]|nr:TonB-dependent receptor [Dysgonamonadaceae bacterium]MDD4728900.1 TonB-dependent receptor [Dysgonamonadaceae bacterium]
MTNNIVYIMIAMVAMINPGMALAQATPTEVELQKPPTDANVFGDVKSEGEHIPYANVYVKGTNIGTSTDETGHYTLINLPVGKHTLIAKFIGYKEQEKQIEAVPGKTLMVNFELEGELMSLDELVVTGTKTFQRKTQAPVIVNVLGKNTLKAVDATNIAEGLNFQPGLRVETDCQTCNYTQLRMNGLGGSYSQILINSRPIFSPLIGLYGLEQIPANMVERIEVVRGGGSALYGSSAIGGTVNVITQIPQKNAYDMSYAYHSINGRANDNMINGNISMVNKKRNVGAVLFVSHRDREQYDHEGLTLQPDGTYIKERDNYSELPKLINNSFGANLFFKPTMNQKLELNFTSMYEYRYGGEMIDKLAHLAKQSEERIHHILMGGLDYEISFNENLTSINAYVAGQKTDRDHYTGLYPEEDEYDTEAELEDAVYEHLSNPPYGKTDNTTMQGGVNINHSLYDFFSGTNMLTGGIEYIYDEVIDSIPQYDYEIDQQTKNIGMFLQSDWKINGDFTLLTGVRADKHNLLDKPIVSPRVSLLYRLKDYTQFRATWGTGFRAPQAFDSDLHIAFAGGGVSRISLDPDLDAEHSNSVSGSVNFDLPTERYIFGFTLEGFYTQLKDAFYLHPTGSDSRGELFEKRNGPTAVVKGLTLEGRANYNKLAQIEAGYTLQSSKYKEAITHFDEIPEGKRDFMRSPNQYGYAVLTVTPTKNFSVSLNSIYTGSMWLAKFSPNEDWAPNEYRKSSKFGELSLKLGYTIPVENVDSEIELFGGIKNITNYFQSDSDNYKNRDSDYMYGPAQPRTFYVGIRLKSI